MRCALAAVVVIAAMATGGTGVAWAHAVRVAADPAPDSTLASSPARVAATFNEELQSEFAAMAVVGPDGNRWSDGSPQVHGATVSVGVRPGGPAGSYTVSYRVAATDGHVVSGSWAFTLATAGGPSAPPVSAAPAAASAPPDKALPVWPFVAGAVVMAAAGGAWTVRRRS